MNWIAGSQYKTRGGQIVTIVEASPRSVEVETSDKSRRLLDGAGNYPSDRQNDLVSLVGPTSSSRKNGKSCG